MLQSLPGDRQPIFHCTAHSQLISTRLVFDFPPGNLLADVIIGGETKVTIDWSQNIIAAVSSHISVITALLLSLNSPRRSDSRFLLRPPSFTPPPSVLFRSLSISVSCFTFPDVAGMDGVL